MNQANKPPTYVALVQQGLIRLHYVSPDARERIAAIGLRLELHDSYYCVPFDDAGVDILSNSSFVDTFKQLNRAGILFGEDHTQMWSPAETMRQIQAKGQCPETVTSLAYRGMDNWFTAAHEPTGIA